MMTSGCGEGQGSEDHKYVRNMLKKKFPSKSHLAHQCVPVVLLRLAQQTSPSKGKILWCTCAVILQNVISEKQNISCCIRRSEDVLIVNDCSPPARAEAPEDSKVKSAWPLAAVRL